MHSELVQYSSIETIESIDSIIDQIFYYYMNELFSLNYKFQ
jgi:hypothetical protein